MNVPTRHLGADLWQAGAHGECHACIVRGVSELFGGEWPDVPGRVLQKFARGEGKGKHLGHELANDGAAPLIPASWSVSAVTS